MDKTTPFADLLAALDALADTDMSNLVNMVDKAVLTASRSHIAIWGRYTSGNQVITDPSTISINGLQSTPYF